MTIPEILEELRHYTGKFPKQAMLAAIDQQEAITPELLREFEQIADNALEYAPQRDFMLHTFAVYLLAQFSETRAFQPLVKMVSLPGELPFDLFGDTITQDLARLLASLYDGDRKALERLIETNEVNEYVRAAALDSLIVLERAGKISRQEVADYFHELFSSRLKRELNYVWTGLTNACADLPAPELSEEVRQAFADDLVEGSIADLRWIEGELAKDTADKKERERDRFSPIDNAISELEGWAAFRPERHTFDARRSNPATLPRLEYVSTHRVSSPGAMRHEPKIGRNDPCPCGSGKKYKKCCVDKREGDVN
jgi:hypothetical protein